MTDCGQMGLLREEGVGGENVQVTVERKLTNNKKAER